MALLKSFGDKLYHVHMNDNYRLWDDDMMLGSAHLSENLEFFSWLKRTEYDGWVSIDQFPYREYGLRGRKKAFARSKNAPAWQMGWTNRALDPYSRPGTLSKH